MLQPCLALIRSGYLLLKGKPEPAASIFRLTFALKASIIGWNERITLCSFPAFFAGSPRKQTAYLGGELDSTG